MLKNKKLLIVSNILLFLICYFTAKSQMNYETLKSLLIYNFTQNIIHSKDVTFEKYKICFLSQDSITFKEFKNVLNTDLIKNEIKKKPVELILKNSVEDFSGIQLLYVDKSFNQKIENIWKNIKNKNIILVTEQCDDAKYIMLNILYVEDEETVSFEINKANIIIENLEILPEIVLLRGKEVYIRELYEYTKNLLDDSKLELEKSKHELKNQSELIEKQQKELEIQIADADSLRQSINLLTEKISKSEGRLSFLTDSIIRQQYILNSKLIQIKLQEEKLEKQNQEIDFKENEIEFQTKKLDSLINESIEQQLVINKQKDILGAKENVIENQRKRQYLLILIGIAFFVFAIIILTAYIVKKNAALNLENKVNERTKELQLEISERIKTEKELENHKNHLEEIVLERTNEISNKNEELKLANEEQKYINEILYNQKLEIEKTLQKLKETQNQLVQSEKMASLGILTAGIAHEINNPVNYINSGLEGLQTILNQIIEILLQQKQVENVSEIENQKNQYSVDFLISGIQKLTKNIQTGVYRTTEIVKSLNAFSRMEEDNLVLADIHQIINSALILLYNNYKNRIKIVKRFEEINSFYCYQGKLNQVFVNVLMNAIQAINGIGEIVISTSVINIIDTSEKNNKFVKISIKDNGHGISDEVKNKIFEPFFTTKEVGQGTGLGLSITHGIIELHKGKIDVNSELGKGSEFVIYLPMNLSNK